MQFCKENKKCINTFRKHAMTPIIIILTLKKCKLNAILNYFSFI